MRLSRLITLIGLFSLSLFNYNCDPPDDDEDFAVETTTVFNEESFVELKTLNGVDIPTVSFTDGVTSGNNVMDASELGGSNLFSFNTAIAAPIDDTVLILATLGSVIINLDDGSQVPPFFASSGSESVIDAGDGVLRENFVYNFTYPGEAPAIPVNTISSIKLVYELEYVDLESGDSIHFKNFTHDILFN